MKKGARVYSLNRVSGGSLLFPYLAHSDSTFFSQNFRPLNIIVFSQNLMYNYTSETWANMVDWKLETYMIANFL